MRYVRYSRLMSCNGEGICCLENVCPGLVDNLYQIAVGVLKVAPMPVTVTGNLLPVSMNLSLIASLLNIINSTSERW